jgi:beta-N-acetylhexosaminidase
MFQINSRHTAESYQMNIQSKSGTEPRDSVLAHFMLGFDGDTLSGELAEYLAHGLAGVVLYRRNFMSAEGLRNLTVAIRQAAGHPVLIGIDQEGGTRFALQAPFTSWPSATELGRLDDVASTERVAHAMAVELRAVGCNLNFAPLLDLHLNSESPVTTDRSFGSDPNRVARMGTAVDRGLRHGGVLSCAKHFPGHGDAVVDPHLDLPVFAGSMERLESMELVPFAAGIAAGVPLVMTAHILLPLIDSENPASLSHVILDGILRRRLRFGGVILADDLGMGAIAKRYGPGEATVRTLRAGTDVAMLCHDWGAVAPAIAAVSRAKEEGRFDGSEWSESLGRIERVCMQTEVPGPAPSLDILGCKDHQQLAEEIRERLR